MSRILLDWQLELGQLSNDTHRQFEETNWGLGFHDFRTFGHESFTSNKNRCEVVPHVGWDGLPISFPRIVVRRGAWNERHQWTERCVASMGFQKLGDWKKLNTSISLLYSGFLAFSQIYFQHSHPNEVQTMQLLATYAKKHMKKHPIAASQKIWTSTFEWLQVPVKPELTNYGMADPRTVRVLDPSKITLVLPWFVPDWGETLRIDLGPFSRSCWTGKGICWEQSQLFVSPKILKLIFADYI